MGLRIDRMTRLATQVSVATIVALTLLTVGVVATHVNAGSPPDGVEPSQVKAGPADRGVDASPKTKVKLGLSINDPRAFQGYTLLNTMNSKKAYLIDMQGRVVQTWETNSTSVGCAYLLENGHLLRPASLDGAEKSFGGGPGAAGLVQEYTWKGDIVWDFKLSNDKQLAHHDITSLPNGNLLLIVWDKKTAKEAVAAGRKKELAGSSHLLPDSLIEVKPAGKTTGQVVWEWHLWDHLVQDHDSTTANYGNVAAHPELVDINYVEDSMAPIVATKAGVAKLKSIGYVGATTGKRPPRVNPDWTHFNSVDYNPALDQIAVSVHEFSEIWIIDHGTTTAEAAGHTGGRSGKGGDLLYRWGNPRTYRSGTVAGQRLFAQHNAHWIPRGLPGEGHILVFNNGGRRPDGNYSSVDELVLPVDTSGHYSRLEGAPYAPDKPVWSYSSPKKSDFFSMIISGAHRLPNGNTFICSGVNGTLFEVTADKETVWKYVNPVKAAPGPGGMVGPPQPGQILPSFVQDMFKMSPEQKKQLVEFQKEVDGKLDKTLTADQKKQLKERSGFGPGGFGGPPLPGQIMSLSTQVRLKPTPDQKKQLDELQKDIDARLDKMFTGDQRKQLKEMRDNFNRGGPPGFGPGGPPGFGPGGPGGPGGFPANFGPPGGSSLFRAYRYAPDYAGLAGKDLKPGKTVEELQPKEPEKKKTI